MSQGHFLAFRRLQSKFDKFINIKLFQLIHQPILVCTIVFYFKKIKIPKKFINLLNY